jgi:hypothetical protein
VGQTYAQIDSSKIEYEKFFNLSRAGGGLFHHIFMCPGLFPHVLPGHAPESAVLQHKSLADTGMHRAMFSSPFNQRKRCSFTKKCHVKKLIVENKKIKYSGAGNPNTVKVH